MNNLPDDVARFIVDHIESVEALEALLLLHSAAARAWSAADVARESRTNEWSAQMHLDYLARHGLLQALGGDPPRFQAEPRASGAVAQLRRVYQDRRVAVITLIYTKPEEAAVDPVQAFADAFKLKKEK